MIKANELRVGNWLLGAYPFQIKLIDETNDFNIYEPIPLTPEILQKSGFEESGFYYYLNDIRLYEYHSDFKVNEGYIFDYGMTKSFANIKYLHQLQNLFFALTGTELEINLNSELSAPL